MRDLNRVAIYTPNDENLQKRIYMSNFAKEIANQSGKHVRSLTKDTRNYFSQTCNGLAELSIHPLGATHEFAMLGNCHSNPLEKQFGKLRHRSGGTYL